MKREIILWIFSAAPVRLFLSFVEASITSDILFKKIELAVSERRFLIKLCNWSLISTPPYNPISRITL